VENETPEAVIMISSGSPKIYGCVITSKMGNGLSIDGIGSSVQCSRCQIENVGSKGIFISNYATGAFTEIQIVASAYIGILLTENANPEFTYCVVKNGKGNGLDARSKARGRFSNCRFVGNAISGMEISGQANPDISGTDICDNDQWGVYVYEGGLGLFTRCFMLDNGRGPFQNATGNLMGVRFDQCITDMSQITTDEKRIHDEKASNMEKGILSKGNPEKKSKNSKEPQGTGQTP
ncbi:MAG: right-handed parallel beta-helix repeat-containing protein, partial [Thermoguttaceae bacterium]|nr:right-handed parallel beta-helix repeat-containing protein [Thermoguttaceae bacterium]